MDVYVANPTKIIIMKFFRWIYNNISVARKRYESWNDYDYHWIGVTQEIFKWIQESLFFDELRVDVVQLGNGDGRRLAHVRVLVLQALAQWLAQVFGDLQRNQKSEKMVLILSLGGQPEYFSE